MWNLIRIAVLLLAVGGVSLPATGGAQNNAARHRLEQRYGLDTLNPHPALAAAVRAGDPLAVQYFLHKGANPGVLVPTDAALPQLQLVNALVLAIRLGQTAVVPHLLADARTNAKTAEGGGLPPLLEAAQRGQWRVVEALLEKGAPLNIQDSLGRNVLELLAELDSTAGFYRMWARWESQGLSPVPTERMVAFATRHCNVDLINFLENKGITLATANYLGVPLAEQAVQAGVSATCLSFLASRGVNFNPGPLASPRLPLLHVAIWANRPHTVEFLLRQGCNPRVAHRYSQTDFAERGTQLAAGEYSALMLAESLARQRIALLLREASGH